LWLLAIGGGSSGCSGERGTLTQFGLTREECVDVSPVLLVAVSDELRRLVRLPLTRFTRFLSRRVFVAALRSFRVRAAWAAAAMASFPSLFVEQL
jgi:hypothetical protein